MRHRRKSLEYCLIDLSELHIFIVTYPLLYHCVHFKINPSHEFRIIFHLSGVYWNVICETCN
jgi:hypothetical protein